MNADIIIIGGGIAGLSAGAALAPDATVLVLEAEDQTGYHSTGRSAAIFIRNYGNAALRALNALAEPALTQGGWLSPRGEVMLATDADLPAFEAYMQGTVGVERIDAGQAVELVPILRPDRIATAMYEPGAQDIDVSALVQNYAQHLRAHAGRIATQSRVTGLERLRGLWHVTTADDNHVAPIVINAAGAWAEHVGQIAGAVSTGLQPMRRSAALIPAPSGYDLAQWPVFGSIAETWYAKPEGGQLMVSPADEDPVEPHDVWPEDLTVAEGIDRFETATTHRVSRVTHKWAGLRSFTKDRTPVVGFDPQVEGFFWLAGQGGYGVQTAPALAMITADLVAGRSTAPGAPLKALSPDRFAQGTPS